MKKEKPEFYRKLIEEQLLDDIDQILSLKELLVDYRRSLSEGPLSTEEYDQYMSFVTPYFEKSNQAVIEVNKNMTFQNYQNIILSIPLDTIANCNRARYALWALDRLLQEDKKVKNNYDWKYVKEVEEFLVNTFKGVLAARETLEAKESVVL